MQTHQNCLYPNHLIRNLKELFSSKNNCTKISFFRIDPTPPKCLSFIYFEISMATYSTPIQFLYFVKDGT